MSEWLSCASTDESMNSTIECTMLCGWTTTSTRDMGTSKSQRASIISSPLLKRVAESIEIFWPMFQVGCLSAWAGVAAAICSRVHCRNGPPEAVSTSRRTVAGVAAFEALEDGVVLAVHGQDAHAFTRRRRAHDGFARHDEDFLARHREVVARLNRRQRRSQSRSCR